MRVLFVCTGNTCRSPMAERLARKLFPAHQWESAGVSPTGWMHPMTARVLTERGAVASGFSGRNVLDVPLDEFDHLVLIGEAASVCAPSAPPTIQEHFWDVDDPYDVVGSENEVLSAYRNCADQLTTLIQQLVAGATKT